MQGQPETAKQLAEAGMMIGIRLHAPFVEAVGWMRMGHAAQLLQKYDPMVAVKCYRASQEMMEQLMCHAEGGAAHGVSPALRP